MNRLLRVACSGLIVFPAVLLAVPTVSGAQATGRIDFRTLAGCYALTVSHWSPADINPAYHRIPLLIRLDTLPTARGGGWVLSPNIAYPSHGAFPGMPKWSLVGDTLRLLWSNGYQPTIVALTYRDSLWTGEAVAESDYQVANQPLPRAQVSARRASCR